MADALIEKVKNYTTQLALSTAAIGVDVLCFYDDVGMQTGLQISPKMWRDKIKPAWEEILKTVRGEYPQIRTFFHCCGKIDSIVSDIIELGFDILGPHCLNGKCNSNGRQIPTMFPNQM